MNPTARHDLQGLGVLDEQQCSTLLDSVHVGRVALTDQALPIILPVGFARLDDDLVFRVGPGAMTRAAEMEQIVCFETDWLDAKSAAAWSVMAIGQLSTVSDPAELARASVLELPMWSAHCSHFVRLRPQVITGRQRPA